jgi:2-polyprenyl-3-methyl-5-hydroxy-6-metoxy-1,4-benzoquinol methylase
MPRAERATRAIGADSVESGREASQLGWYEYAAQVVKGKTVLDVGCGLGHGLDILRRTGRRVLGLDLDPRLARDGVLIASIESIGDGSYDVVTAIEVIEHIEEDAAFAEHLCRVAREFVFITTPNWTVTRCKWPYHVREYTPQELTALLEPHGRVELFKGTYEGSLVYPVRHERAYYVFNSLRAWPPTAFVTRCVNHLLPRPFQIRAHNAVILHKCGLEKP